MDSVGQYRRKAQLEILKQMQEGQLEKVNDPEIEARIAQYEMAFRMQTSVPEITGTSDEPDYIYDLYGPDSRDPGTFAANCLLARRLAEKGVKFIQLYHRGWDQHLHLPEGIQIQCKLQHRRKSGTRPRFPNHHHASPRHRS